MPPQQGIWRDNGVELEQSLSPYGFGFPRQQRALGISEPDTLSAQPVFKKSVLSLKEFDDDLLMAMNPASGNHQ
jgi:hypothetical protein